jgi:hypothetical protein
MVIRRVTAQDEPHLPHKGEYKQFLWMVNVRPSFEEDDENVKIKKLYTNPAVRYEAWKGVVQAAYNLAVEAAADALCAAARTIIVKALERERKQSAATTNRVAAPGPAAAPLVDVSNLV